MIIEVIDYPGDEDLRLTGHQGLCIDVFNNLPDPLVVRSLVQTSMLEDIYRQGQQVVHLP